MVRLKGGAGSGLDSAAGTVWLRLPHCSCALSVHSGKCAPAVDEQVCEIIWIWFAKVGGCPVVITLRSTGLGARATVACGAALAVSSL